MWYPSFSPTQLTHVQLFFPSFFHNCFLLHLLTVFTTFCCNRKKKTLTMFYCLDQRMLNQIAKGDFFSYCRMSFERSFYLWKLLCTKQNVQYILRLCTFTKKNFFHSQLTFENDLSLWQWMKKKICIFFLVLFCCYCQCFLLSCTFIIENLNI